MRLITPIVFLLLSASVAAQDTLAGNYARLSLSSGAYFVSGSVTIDSVLAVSPGVSILFSEGGSLICQGSVFVEGTAENRILLQSSGSRRGNGLIIKSQRNESPVVIRHAQFLGLSSALRFEVDWIRPSVLIRDCEFINNTNSIPVITVMSPRYEAGLNNPRISFELEGSLFTRNGASLYLEDMITSNLLISVSNNIFINNRLADFGVYNFSGNVLYGRADKRDPSLSTVLEGNSFLQNYLVSIVGDTIVQRTSMGVFGSADSIRAPRNFWGVSQLAAIRSSLFDFYTNYTSPRFIVEPFLTTPSQLSPPHLYSICASDSMPNSSFTFCHLLEGRFSLGDLPGLLLQLKSNRPLRSESAQLSYTWLDDSLQEQTRVLPVSFRAENGRQTFTISLDSQDKDLFVQRPGYLQVDGFMGDNNETIPSLQVGYDQFLQAVYILKKRAEEDKAKGETGKEGSSADSLGSPLDSETTLSSTTAPKTRFYLKAGGNISHQQIADFRPLQTLIFPIDGINSTYIQPGFSGTLRWDQKIYKSLFSSVAVGYSYLRTSIKVDQALDTLAPFANRFTSFMPRTSFQFVGVQAGLRATLFSSFSLLAGGAIDYNLLPKTRVDKQTPSYDRYIYSTYTGLEAALPSRNQLPAVLIGIRWRRWFSSVTAVDVSNKIDMVEITAAISLSNLNTKTKKVKK